MPDYVVGGRTEYFLSNRDGDPTWDENPSTGWETQQINNWLTSLGDPNVFGGACDLYESWGADPFIQAPGGGRYPTASDNLDPYLALVAVGKTNIQGYDNPIWYRTFFVLTQNPETPGARQIVGGKQFFWLPGETPVSDYAWGTETSDWIGIGVSGDGLKAASSVGQLFFSQQLGDVGNIVILGDPSFGEGGLDDLNELELEGHDVPIAPDQLIALSQHAPFEGSCWTQTRFFALPANARNPNRIGPYGMTWVGWIERVWATNGGNPAVTNRWGSSSTEVSHDFIGQWWKPGSKWGPSVMALHFAPRTEVQWSGWTVLPGHNATTQAGDAAVVYRNKLYLFGVGKAQHHHFVQTFDGTSWSGWHGLPGTGTTQLADAAAVYQDKLYLFGVGLSNDQQVNVFDGTAWSGWTAVPGGATLGSADAAVAFGGKLYLFAFSPRDSSNRASLKMNSFDGSNWAGWSDVPGSAKTTSLGFAATVYSANLYLFAQDQQGTPILSTFDGSSWAAWTKVGSDWFGWTEVINGVQYEVSVDIFDAVTDGNNLFLFTSGIVTEVDSNSPVKLRMYVNLFDGKKWLGWSTLPEDDFALGTSTNAAALYAGKLYLFGIINGIDHLNVLSV
jgi:hypothetical protein